MDNYKDFPPTVGELRSDKSKDSKDWTPRDALIAVLRMLDSGENITDLIVCFRDVDKETGKPGGRYRQATSNTLITLGLMTYISANIATDKD